MITWHLFWLLALVGGTAVGMLVCILGFVARGMIEPGWEVAFMASFLPRILLVLGGAIIPIALRRSLHPRPTMAGAVTGTSLGLLLFVWARFPNSWLSGATMPALGESAALVGGATALSALVLVASQWKKSSGTAAA
jgi:hypothetical protein